MKVIESKNPDGREGWTIRSFKGGYIVESIFRAMWHVTRELHDKYGRVYDFGCFNFDQDQIRPEEVFPDVASAKEYIENDYNTADQLAKKEQKKQEKLAKKEQEERKLLAELKNKYPV